ncbi:MAG: nucleotidyltransferase domain-containing protein [Candidatus Hodarchaeales archaeon]
MNQNGHRYQHDLSELKDRTQDFIEEIISAFSDSTIYLVGSYSSGTNSKGSDIDILVFVGKDEQSRVVNHMKRQLNTKFKDIKPKIDCKILKRENFHQLLRKHYLMLYSMLSTGKHKNGIKIPVKISPDLLKNAFMEYEEELLFLHQYIDLAQDYDIIACKLFSITRSFFFLARIISTEQQKSIKTILGKQFYKLAKIWERYTDKGIVTELTTVKVRKGQKSGNFKDLFKVHAKVAEYKNTLKKEFYNWYDYESKNRD